MEIYGNKKWYSYILQWIRVYLLGEKIITKLAEQLVKSFMWIYHGFFLVI